MPKQRPSQPSSKKIRMQLRERQLSRTPGTGERPGVRTQRRPGHKRNSLRAGLAVIGGRAAGALSRRLHLGGGTSIVGVVAQRLYPDIVEHLGTQLEYGSIIVTGTNGKTTTSSFIAAILRDAGLRVWRNREGSNLMRGVASSLVIRALPSGRLRLSGRAISIFEVDEAVLPQLVQVIPPRVIVFTNLFRDQLDRYGEVDSVVARWREAVGFLPVTTTLVLNADDPSVAALGASFAGTVQYYGIDDLSLALEMQGNTTERHQVVDTRTCPRCGGDYEYTVRFYSHMGHYHCPHCGLERPQADVRAVSVQSDSFDRLRIRVATPTKQREVVIPLPGLYNTYNALAAITAAQAVNVGWEPIITGIEQSKPVFGRGERVQAEGRTIRLLLAKNPTGFNEVLRTLFSDGTPRHVLFILNDNTADGRDISWIWDVDFERVVGQVKTLVVSGSRALDLALRLKYAGIAQEEMTIIPPAPLRALRRDEPLSMRIRRVTMPGMQTAEAMKTLEQELGTQARSFGLKKALAVALEQTPIGETLFVVPTYTGLLEIHRELEQRGLTPHYWEGRDT